MGNVEDEAYQKMSIERLEMLRTTVLQLQESNSYNYLFHFDDKGGRLYTRLSNLKKELRHFVSYGGESLYSVDLKNSQPYLLLSLGNGEVKKWKKILQGTNNTNNQLCNINNIGIIMLLKSVESQYSKAFQSDDFTQLVTNGCLYEEISARLGQEYPELQERSAVKTAFCRLLFYNPALRQASCYAITRAIEGLFPEITKVLDKLKAGNYTRLPILLQSIERYLIIDTVCKQLHEEYPDAVLSTIHDSIITTAQYVPIVKQRMEEVLSSFVGYPPKLEIEEWNPALLENESIKAPEWVYWKPIMGFPKYEVCSDGRIRFLDTQRRLKNNIDVNGYRYVKLEKEGLFYHCYVHYIVAATFVQNSSDVPFIGHINGIVTDNRKENIVWTGNATDRIEQYCFTVSSSLPKKHRFIQNEATGDCYASIKEASQALDKHYTIVREVLNGTRKKSLPIHYCDSCS